MQIPQHRPELLSGSEEMTEPAAQLDRELIRRERLEPLLDALAEECGESEPLGGERYEGYSGDRLEVNMDDGRTLMVKRASHEAAGAHFEAARRASRLLRGAEIGAPAYLDLPDGLYDLPVLVYWRISQPTLAVLWPRLSEAERLAALRSWGELTARIHRIRFPGHGPLQGDHEPAAPLATVLEEEITGGLLPAVRAQWAAGVARFERLAEAISEIAACLGESGGVLLHNDLHRSNLLCEVEEDGVRCTGVLDLESATAGPPEADLARPAVLYGPWFRAPLTPFFEPLREGYGASLESGALAFFRAYHLLKLGHRSACVGYREHAALVADAAEEELDALSCTV
jgi:hypothetical protein